MKPEILKPRRLSEVSNKRPTGDKLSGTKGLPDRWREENHQLLSHARQLWDDLADFRQRRRRSMRYHRGDQWGDLIKDPDTDQMITEEEYIKKQGKVPLKQNLIRSLIKNLQGQYRRSPTKTIVYARNREDAALSEMMSNAIQTIHDINGISQLDAALLAEGAIGGLAISKDIYNYIPDKEQEDVDMGMVNPGRVFFNSDLEDPLHRDIREIGEMHDLPLSELIGIFALHPGDEEKIRRWYSEDYYKDFMGGAQALSHDMQESIDFFLPHSTGLSRAIEYWYQKSEWRMYVHDYYDGSYYTTDWTKKELEEKNQERIDMMVEMGVPEDEVPPMEGKRKYDHYWYVKFLTPYGHTLYEGESPYWHKSHPYTLFMYPFIGGAVWGLVEDIIDQQRYINRTITMQDFIIGASSKGLLLVHEDNIPKGVDISDFASQWSRVGGVIKYKGKPGTPPPQQVASNSIPAGLNEMLSNQLKLTYDIMGIHHAMQGQRAPSGTPASLYAQEIDQSTINIKEFMESFTFFKESRDRKVLTLIKQYYQERRPLVVKGTGYAPEAKLFDPNMVKNVEFDLVVTQGPDTPVYRQIIEDILTNLLQNQLIDLEMYLEHSSMPFADKLLETVRQKRQEAVQQGGGDPQLMESLAQAQGQMPEQTQQITQAMYGQ